MITTGGTIAGQAAADYPRNDEVIRGADDFAQLVFPTVSYLSDRLDIDIDIDTLEFANVDSSDVDPQMWIDLAALIKERYDEYDGFLITHGTNTLGYTSAALTFALPNLAKPVILTGSQVPAGLPGSDALINLENALRVAVWRMPDGAYGLPVRGVIVVFGSHIITGTRVKKDTEFALDAFKSFGTNSIGRIGRIINFDDRSLAKHISYQETYMYQPARTASELECENSFDMRIASLTEFPGMAPDVFAGVVEHGDIRGIILRAFGAGDPCSRHLEAFQVLKDRGIPLVVATQAPNGISNFQVNESGRALRANKLAIPTYDMSIEATTVKLGWLLAKLHDGELTYPQLVQQMLADLRGEITVTWERAL